MEPILSPERMSVNLQWKFLDGYLIRSTGFAFSLLQQFRFHKTSSNCNSLWEIDLKINKMMGEIRSAVHDAFASTKDNTLYAKLNEIRPRAYKRHSVPPEFVPAQFEGLAALIADWNASLGRFESLWKETEAIFESELMEARAKLKSLIENDLLYREAMFLSSVGTSESIVKSYLEAPPESRNRKIRERERFFINNLQRVCAKNETASFFGPINFGTFKPQNHENMKISFGTLTGKKRISRNEVFFSHWACYKLAEIIGQDASLRHYVIPRQTPFYYAPLDRAFYYVSDNKVYYFGLEEKNVDPLQMEILRKINGELNFKEILQSLQDVDEERFWTACSALAQEKIITMTPIISPFSYNGIADLSAFLNLLPPNAGCEPFKAKLDKLEELRTGFRDSPYPDRARFLKEAECLFEELTADKARRGEGDFYVDRSIFSEDAVGVISSFEIGGNLFEKLSDSLGGVMTILAAVAAAEWENWQFLGKEVLARLSDGKMRLPLVEFWNEFDDLADQIKEEEPFKKRKSRLAGAIDLIREFFQEASPASAEARNSLVAETIRALREAELLRGRKYPLCATPDILIDTQSIEAANGEHYTAFLGEMHNHLFPIFYATAPYFCPWREAYEGQINEILKKIAKPHEILQISLKREIKLFPAKLQCKTLYFQEPSLNDPEPVFLRDLYVTELDGEIVLQHAKSKQTFVFPGHIIKDPNYDFLKIFSFPYIDYLLVYSGKNSARKWWGDLVYQRATWRMDGDDLKEVLEPSGLELFWAAHKLARTFDFPSCVFVRHPMEKKPFFVDFENYFLLEIFQHTVRRSPEAWVSEFAPGENGLWLNMNGDQYCTELRIGLYAEGAF